MKPAVHKISDASFIGHYFKLLVSRLHQFKTAKHVVLIGVVLVCLLARYVILLGDSGPVKAQSVTEKYQKMRIRVPKLIFLLNEADLQNNNRLKLKQAQFNLFSGDFKILIVNKMQ